MPIIYEVLDNITYMGDTPKVELEKLVTIRYSSQKLVDADKIVEKDKGKGLNLRMY